MKMSGVTGSKTLEAPFQTYAQILLETGYSAHSSHSSEQKPEGDEIFECAAIALGQKRDKTFECVGSALRQSSALGFLLGRVR